MTNNSDRLSEGEVTDLSDSSIQAQYEWSSTLPSTAVVETVAIATNREPTATEPLYESVDPDALNALMQSDSAQTSTERITISFVFVDQEVTVHSTGEVIVRSVTFDD